jgi:NAD-dependent deacetylase
MPRVGDDLSQLEMVAKALSRAYAVAVLTGAGISAESGVPTFRGPDGLWRQFRAEQLATPEAFAREPALVWEWYRWRRDRLASVSPNAGHLALARIESRLPTFTLITQNVDGLHARAGSRRVLELHGSIWRDRCTGDASHRLERWPTASTSPCGDALPRCPCGALLRPDVVWFGESLDAGRLEAAADAVRTAEILLVIGTSSVVYPAAALPGLARRAGARVVEINPEDTPLSGEVDVALRGLAGVLLPALEQAAFGGPFSGPLP